MSAVFWLLAVLMIASAIWVVSAKKPVYSVVGLLAHFLFLAIMFLTLNAEFMAAIQLIVYSGAILVLFLFVIALLSSGVSEFSVGPDRLPKIAIPAAGVLLVALGFLIYGIGNIASAVPIPGASASVLGPVGDAGVFGSVADFGKALFTTYLLPFEMTALILMVSVIGVISLAGETPPQAGNDAKAREVRRKMREAIVRGGEN
jgi:NADH-quinone oxidoreductase subunit J